MFQLESSDSDEELVERGKEEKEKVSKIIFKKKKLEIVNFFTGYRNFIKCEEKKSRKSFNGFDIKNEIFQVFFHELESSLTNSQKEFMVKEWRKKGAPIIFLGEIDQLQDIHKYLSSRDLARVRIDRKKQIVDLSLPNSLQENNDKNINYYYARNLEEHCNGIMNAEINDSFSENTYKSVEDSSNYDNEILDNFEAAMTLDQNCSNILDVDFLLGSKKMWNNFEIKNEENVQEKSYSVEDLYEKFTKIIKIKEDVLNVLKCIQDATVYKKVFNYKGMDQEPIMFQLALNINIYEDVFEFLRQNNVLNLHQQNFVKITMFSFLLIHDVERLYAFVLYAQKINWLDEVKKVCSNDKYLKKNLSELKRDSRNPSQKAMIHNLQKLCFTS